MLYSFHYGSKRDVRILIVTTKMKGIYANIIWFAIVIFGLSGAAFWRHNSTEWASMADSRLVYNLVYGLVAMYLIVATVGLIIKRKVGLCICCLGKCNAGSYLNWTFISIISYGATHLERTRDCTNKFKQSTCRLGKSMLLRMVA